MFDKDDFEAPSLAELREISNGTSKDADGPVNVFNLQGTCVRHKSPQSEALRGLPAGIYIINGKKITIAP